MRALSFVLPWFLGLAISAQDPAATPIDASVANVEARARAAAQSPELAAAAKETAAQIYADALASAKAAAASDAAAAAALAATEAVPELVPQKRAELTAPASPVPDASALASRELSELEEQLAAARTASASAAASLQAKEAERQRRAARLADLPELIAAAAAEEARLRGTSAEAPPDEPALLTEAREIRIAAQLAAASARVRELEAERRQFEAELTLQALERDVLERAVERQAQLVELLDAAVQERRRADAAADTARADQQAENAHPALAPLAESNQSLAAERELWAEKLVGAGAALKAVTQRRSELESRFGEIEKRIELAGLSEAIGLQLRQEKARLPSVRRLRARIEARRAELVAVHRAQFDVEDRRRAFEQARPAVVQEVLEGMPADADAATRRRIEREGAVLLERRGEYFERLVGDLDAYRQVLGDLDTEERLLVERATHYTNYVNERVLWIRSTQPVWHTDWGAVSEAVAWLLAPDGWSGVGSAFMAALEHGPVSFVLGVLLALVLIVLGRPARRRIAALGEQAASSRVTSFAPTAWTFVLIVLAASGWPLLVWHFATWLQGTPGIGEFSSAIAGGLAHVAVLFGVAELFRLGMRRGGLAEAHLGWPEARTRMLRRNLAWFLPSALPIAFVLRVLSLHANVRWSYMLDRLLLVAILVLIAGFLARILHPERGAPAAGGAGATGGSKVRRQVCFAAGILVPVALAVVASAGYHFSALELLYRLEQSLGVLVVAVLVHELGIRWMLLAKRRLAIAQAKARREAAKAKASEERQEPGEAPPMPVEVVSIATVDQQSRKLLRGGLLLVVLGALWLIWGEVLPALRGLGGFELWDNYASASDADPTPITLANLILALFVLVVTFAAARNIPGLLELAVLQRLNIHAGERAAFTTLVRYGIVAIGFVISFSSIGIGWGKVQWLIAAMSVGLGFGLQEIFANFVSGVIILFERPIRVGDIVTVGGVDGYVQRIRMRATTILDFDRKEMIVPNKEFVTSRLVNWTLSDSTTRVKLPVGIAYGSDTERARALLLQIAAECELILKEPPPAAIFRGFGESALQLELWVFIATRDHWKPLMNQLHTAIDRAFREAKIEISFPQRDLHLRTLGPLAEVVAKPNVEPADGQRG